MTHCASYRGIPRQCRARGQYRAVALTCIRPCPFCAHEPPVVAAVRSDGVKRDLGYVPAFAAIGPMAAALPICRAMWKWNRRLGGNGEASAAEGGYSLVVAVLFNEAAVKLDFLGFRNARSDDFAPLHLPKGKSVGRGLRSNKLRQLAALETSSARSAKCRRFGHFNRWADYLGAGSPAPFAARKSSSRRKPRMPA